MDLILLPDLTLDRAALARLNTLMAWLAADAEPLDVYALIPAQRDEEERFFAMLASLDAGPGFLYLVLPAPRVDDALLRRIDESGVAYVIVDDDGVADVDAALASIVEYFDRRPDSSLMLGVWSRPAGTGGDRARLQRWIDAGIAPEVVRPRPFPLPQDDAAARTAVPPQLLGELLGCSLYTGAFAVGGDGRIRACPRDGGNLGVDLGTLHEAPEELVIKRGRVSLRAGNFAMCESCTARGRFSWVAARGASATALWSAGRAAALAPAAAALPEGGAADEGDGDIDATLRDFEQRLEQWTRREQALGRPEE